MKWSELLPGDLVASYSAPEYVQSVVIIALLDEKFLTLYSGGAFMNWGRCDTEVIGWIVYREGELIK